MQTVSDTFQNATVASSRTPGMRTWVNWDRSETTSEWFRLDESQLDSGAMLTLTSYSQNEVPDEIISDADNFIYVDESENVISVEGLAEFWGEDNESALSELDVVLDNTTERYDFVDDKNVLVNPSFESFFFKWNIAQGPNGGYNLVGSGNNVVSGSAAARLYNPDSDPVTTNYIHSDTYSIQSGTSYTASVFARGTGDLTMRIVGVGSGANAVSSGTATHSLSSGSFQRFSVTDSLPIEASTARLDLGVSSGAMIVDCAQLEESNVMTDYDDEFIGDLILPKRPIKVEISMLDTPTGSGGVIPTFTGLTETLEPSIKSDDIHIQAYDFGRELKETPAVTSTSTGASMFVDQRSDVVMRHLANMGSLSTDSYEFDVGKNTVPFFWVREGTIWYYMTMLAEAEGGRIFFDETGVLKFWNRDHVDNNSDSQFQFTFEDNILDYSYRIDKDDIYNHVVVKAFPRELQANQSIWTQESPREVRAGDNETIWCTLEDPITEATQPSSTGSTSYIRGNTEIDSSGTDISSNLYIQSFDVFAKDIKIIVDNQSGQDGYVTAIDIYGKPAKLIHDKGIEIEVEDENSIDDYGRSTLQIENDYILTEDYAQNLANDKLFNLKDPRDKVKMSVAGVPYLQLGDVVTIPEGRTGRTKDLFIKRKRWQLLENDDYIEHLLLEKKTLATYFQLDISELDGNHVLSE